MPNPLILLEEHFDPSARIFIRQHLAQLKQLGYRKFLLEMNSEITPDDFKLQLRTILEEPSSAGFYLQAQALLELLSELEKNRIDYEFIDPETQKEAHQANRALAIAVQSRDDALIAVTRLSRERTTALRDKKLAKEIDGQAQLYQGGIIYLGGNQHRELIKALEAFKPDFYRTALIIDSRAQITEFGGAERVVLQMKDETRRFAFYDSYIHYFDWNHVKNWSFDWIEAALRLTPAFPCEPSVGVSLGRVTKQSYSCEMDQHGVVSAKIEIDSDDTTDTTDTTDTKAHRGLIDTQTILTAHFPGLRYFILKTRGNPCLMIPGINLPENTACLSEGFRRLDR